MDEFLQILSLRRHSLLNHLQVISGYLQLNKVGRAMEYIGHMTNELTKESQVCNCRSPQVALALLYLQSQATLAGLHFPLRVLATLDKSSVSEEHLAAIVGLFSTFFREKQAQVVSSGQPEWSLDIGEDKTALRWQFGISQDRVICRQFYAVLNQFIDQAGLNAFCQTEEIEGGVRLVIQRFSPEQKNGHTMDVSADEGGEIQASTGDE